MLDAMTNGAYGLGMGLLDDIRHAIDNSSETRYRIAQETGLSNGQLSRLMSGERGLRLDALEMLADHLGYRVTLKKKTKGAK